MQIDWTREPQNRLEKRLSRNCSVKALRFLRQITDPIVVERYAGREKAFKLGSIQRPIILNAYDALRSGETVVASKDDVPREFLEQHGVDWSYISSAMFALVTVQAIEFTPDGAGGDRFEFRASNLITQYAEPEEDLDYSKPLDVHTASEHPEVNTFIDDIYEAHFADAGGQEAIAKKHLKVVLLDLYVCWSIDPRLKIGMSRDQNDYKKSTNGQTNRYNQLHLSKKIIEVADKLKQAGLINIKKGFEDPDTGASRNSRIWPTEALIEKFRDARFSPLDIDPHWGEECIILRDQKTKYVTKRGVRKKIEENVPKQYRDNRNTKKMREVLTVYNDLLRYTYIDIPTLEEPYINLEDRRHGKPKRISVNQSDKYVRRIFNRGSWKKGGRFWGGWWQRCPKDWRAAIFIDDQSISELDYSGLHIVILYAQQGIDYWQEIGSDPYEIDPPAFINDPDRLRAIAKNLMLVALNAKDEKAAFAAFRQEADRDSPDKSLKNAQLKQLLDKLRDKHERIADKFASDAGIDLMNTDSQITEQIIQHFTDHEVPILTIHDSYIVPFGKEQELEEQMVKAFHEVTGIENVKLKEETHNPLAWEPQSLEDAEFVSPSVWEQMMEYRTNPPRTDRYKHHYEQFQDWLARDTEARTNG